MEIKKRRRGTAIVETSKGILVTAVSGKNFILPGGGAKKEEIETEAAIRELKEETGLIANSAKFLFRHIGEIQRSDSGNLFQDHHNVCLIRATGIPKPRSEIKRIAFYNSNSKIKISPTTKDIIEKYYNYEIK